MDRQTMTDRIIGRYVARISQELKEGNAETLDHLLRMLFDDLTLREFIDAYNEEDWSES